MRLLKRFFDFYLDASIHVALAVVSLVAMTAIEMSFIPSIALMGFVFFGSISGYNFVKYAKAAGLHHRSLTRSLREIQLFSIFSIVGVFCCMYNLPLNLILITGVFGLLTLLYAVPFPKKNLRNYPGIKLIVVGVVWSGVTVLLPQLELIELNETSYDLWQSINRHDVWILFVQRILLVMVFTLPFEIRDLPYDPPHLKTLPQQVGVKKTIGIGIAMLTIAFMMEGFKSNAVHLIGQLMPSPTFLSMFLICVFTAILLVQSQKKQSKYFASFGVESIPIVWVLLYIGLINLF